MVCSLYVNPSLFNFVTYSHIQIVFKKAYDSVRREVMCNKVSECGIPMKLVMLIKMCLKPKQSPGRQAFV